MLTTLRRGKQTQRRTPNQHQTQSKKSVHWRTIIKIILKKKRSVVIYRAVLWRARIWLHVAIEKVWSSWKKHICWLPPWMRAPRSSIRFERAWDWGKLEEGVMGKKGNREKEKEEERGKKNEQGGRRREEPRQGGRGRKKERERSVGESERKGSDAL